MTTVDAVLVETVDRLLDDVCPLAVVEQAEADGWCAPAWDALTDAGFARISIPEAAGGSGGSLADAMAVLRAVGTHAAPVPLAETAVLGGWLLAQAGLELPDGPITVAPPTDALVVADGRLTGWATVPWARRAAAIVALARSDDGWIVIRLDPDVVEIDPGANLAGEPRDTVRFDLDLDALDHAPAPPGVHGATLRLRGALSRVVMMAGAADALSRLTVDYTHQRQQFGQPIARFQAVQHHLVTIAQGAAQLSLAADIAVRAMLRGEAAFEIAAAKVLADEAAMDATRSAHQAHGAIGMTREYGLHHLSRRLWAWRHEYGDARAWRRRLGATVGDGGADALFATITSRP